MVMLNALYITECIKKVHTKDKMRKKLKIGQTKMSRWCDAYKSHKIDFAEKVVFQHAFKNVNGRCFSNF